MALSTTLFVSPLLTDHAIRYSQDANAYIADKVFPVISVKKRRAQIATYGMDNYRIVEALRAQGSYTNEVGHTITIGDHYDIKERALKQLVTRQEQDDADRPIEPKQDAVENLMDRMRLIREKLMVDTVTNTAVISQNTTLSGTSRWDDYSNSDPIGDIRTGITTVRSGSGKLANTLIIAWDAFDTLIYHPDFIARAQGAVVVTAEVVVKIIQQVFPSIQTVLVGQAQYNSAVEGGTDTLTDLWTKVALVAYIEQKPKLKSRSLGFTYRLKSEDIVVDELPMEKGGEGWDRKGDFVRVTEEYDQKLVDEKCAYLMKSVIN